MQKSVATFLVDPNKLFREGLKKLLADTRFEIVGESSEASTLTAQATQTQQAALVLLDTPAGADHLNRDIAAVHGTLPEARIVVLTQAMSHERLSAAFSAGADGYLIKDISYQALLESLHLVMLGEKVFPTSLATLIVSKIGPLNGPAPSLNKYELSGRELQILGCLVEGASNKVIANQLSITEATVKVHLKSILRKINASNRTQAAIWALNHGVSSRSAAEANLAAR